jgi:hypothetical protein
MARHCFVSADQCARAASQIGERAAKEHHIEQQLDKMAVEWNSVTLDIEPYRCV